MNASYRYSTAVKWETSQWEPPHWVDMDAGRVTLGSAERLPLWLTTAPSSPEEVLNAALACAAALAVDESRALWIAAAASGPIGESIHARRPPLALAVRASVVGRHLDAQPLRAELAVTIPEPTTAEVAQSQGAPIVARRGDEAPRDARPLAPLTDHRPTGLHFTLEPDEEDFWQLTLQKDGGHEVATLFVEADAADEQAALLDPWAGALGLLAEAERVRGPQFSAAEARRQREGRAELRQEASALLPDAEAGPMPSFVRSWRLGGPSDPFGPAWGALYPLVVQRWAKASPTEG